MSRLCPNPQYARNTQMVYSLLLRFLSMHQMDTFLSHEGTGAEELTKCKNIRKLCAGWLFSSVSDIGTTKCTTQVQ